MIERNYNHIIVKPSRKSIIGQLIVSIILFNMAVALIYYKFGVVLGIFASLVTVLICLFILAIVVPASLELDDSRLVCTKKLPKRNITIFYDDIEEMGFEDYSTGRGKIQNYYLVTKCTQNQTYKIPLRALISNPKKQAEIIWFILERNPKIQFPFSLSRYDDWVCI